jgi:hypothetical protein
MLGGSCNTQERHKCVANFCLRTRWEETRERITSDIGCGIREEADI